MIRKLRNETVGRMDFADQTWATDAGHAAKTASLANVNGICTRIDVVVSSVTANPTVNVVITDADSNTMFTFNGLADGTHHIKLARSNKGTQDADFNEVPFCEDTLTVSIDPSADAGGTLQTLTVSVRLFLV
jgi:hypothetical protein